MTTILKTFYAKKGSLKVKAELVKGHGRNELSYLVNSVPVSYNDFWANFKPIKKAA